MMFIAEVSSNHEQNLKRCLEFVDVSSRIGCDAVKFQLFKIDQLFAAEIVSSSEAHSQRRAWELPATFLPHIAQRCRDNKIQFGCTPFYLDAVDELVPYVDFLKISSYELLWTDLLTACGRSGKAVMLSTGMATMEEIDDAVATLTEAGCPDLTILHCVSAYPSPPEACNLRVIDTFRRRYQVKTGWSDHSVDPGVIYRAVWDQKCDCIEFHLDLDGQGAEFSSGHCWLPQSMATVIDTIQRGNQAGGTGKKRPAVTEMTERDWRADPRDGLRPFRYLRKDTR